MGAFLDEIGPTGTRAAPRQLTPREQFERTQQVFTRFGLSAEPESLPYLGDLDGLQSPDVLAERLPFLDPDSQWVRYTQIDSLGVSSFQDRDSRQTSDFALRLSDTHRPSVWLSGLSRQLRLNQAARPLRGLRIALDPGHMGTDEWDERTGKYVEGMVGGRMRRISEATLATQVALLAERDLTALGATVMLTRRTLGTVSDIRYEDLDVQEFARRELRASSLAPWFLQRLPQGGASFDQAPQIRAMFAEASRSKYYILREDIDARARLIKAFNPDITLVIHFDSDTHQLTTRRLPYTKVYVEGAFLAEEFATREARREFAEHLLHPDAWEASVALSQSIVNQFRDQLGIQLSPTGGAAATKLVRPGVFARNLGLSRRLPRHAISYLECMFYNDAVEFPRLLAEDHTIDIGGTPYPYSERLATVARAVVAGVTGFAAQLRQNGPIFAP
jgi:N-acetylmuramoyl-L-alanine amidase